MKRLTSIPGLILAALGTAAAAHAQQNAAGPHPPMGFALHRLEKCLASADISPDARAAAEAALVSGRDVLKADGAAMKAAHQRLQTDIANGADKAAIGQDAIDAEAARTKLHTDVKTIHDQVFSALSADEQDALRSCAAAHTGGAWKRGQGSASPTQ